MRPNVVVALTIAFVIGCAVVASIARASEFDLRRIVHREKSMYRNIFIAEGERHRCMTFGRRAALQTCIRIDQPDLLVMPYAHGMLAGLMAQPNAKRVLIIGLGGGILPTALRKIDPAMLIDVVELDPSVVDVAKSHFGFREDARLRAFVNDGRVFVRRQTRLGARYDLIFVDAFENNYIPEHMITQEFIQELRAALRPGGILAANTFTNGKLSRYEAATYQSVFGELRVVDPDGLNRILLTGRDGLPTMETIRRNALRLVPKLSSLGVDTHKVLSQFKTQPRVLDVEPLTDQHSPANLLFEY